jgi:hypothetical protein
MSSRSGRFTNEERVPTEQASERHEGKAAIKKYKNLLLVPGIEPRLLDSPPAQLIHYTD